MGERICLATCLSGSPWALYVLRAGPALALNVWSICSSIPLHSEKNTWKQFNSFFVRLNRHLPHGTTIPLQIFTQRNETVLSSQKHIYKSLHYRLTHKKKKHKYLPIGGRVAKYWCIFFNGLYCSALKMYRLPKYTRVNHKNLILHKRNNIWEKVWLQGRKKASYRGDKNILF